MLKDVQILNQREDYQFDPGGRQTRGIRTTFLVGHDGPFSVFVSDADFSAVANQQAIETKADAVRDVRAHPDLTK